MKMKSVIDQEHVAVGEDEKKRRLADERAAQRIKLEQQQASRPQKKPQVRKIVGYDMRTADYMKSRTLKILSHFENKELKVKCTDDSVLLKPSSEDMLIDKSNFFDEVEQQALSQHVPNDYSMLDVNGMSADLEGTVDMGLGNNHTSDTESECSERELERRDCLTSTPLGMDCYRNYLLWFARHSGVQNEKKTGFLDQLNQQQPEIGLDDMLDEPEVAPRRSSRHIKLVPAEADPV